MSVKTLMFLTSALAKAGLVIEPLAANADGMSQLGTWGQACGDGRQCFKPDLRRRAGRGRQQYPPDESAARVRASAT